MVDPRTGKKASLSLGIKSAFENTPKPGRIPVSDRQMAWAVNQTDNKFSFLPQDHKNPSWLSFNGSLSNTSSRGPFELTFRVGEFYKDRFLPHWVLFSVTDGCYVSSSVYNKDLVKQVVIEAGAHYKDPLKEPVVILPVPPWIKTDQVYYCLNSEYSQIIENFVRQLVEIKLPNPSE